MSKQKKAKKLIIKLLKKSGKQFFDNKTGKKITVEEYVDSLLKQGVNDLMTFKNEIQLRRGRKLKR